MAEENTTDLETQDVATTTTEGEAPSDVSEPEVSTTVAEKPEKPKRKRTAKRAKAARTAKTTKKSGPVGSRGRGRGYQFTDAQVDYVGELLMEHGYTETLRILRDDPERSQDRNKRILPKPVNTSHQTLRLMAAQNGWDVRPRTAYTAEQRVALAELVRKHGISETQEILASDDHPEHDFDVFPFTTNVAVTTLRLIAADHGVEVPKRGYTEDQERAIAKLVQERDLNGAMEILNDPARERQRPKKLFPEPVNISRQTVIRIAKDYGVKYTVSPRGRGVTYTEAQQEWMANLVGKVGFSEALDILRNEERAGERHLKLFPKVTNVSYPTLKTFVTKFNIEPRNARYTEEQLEWMAKLVGKVGYTEALDILRNEERASDRNKKLFPRTVKVSYSTLRTAVEVYEVATPSPRNRWESYTDAQKEYMANLLQEHGRQNALRILREEKGEWAKKRNTKVFPEPINIALSTLNKVLEEYEIDLPLSARTRWESYTDAQKQYMADLLQEHGRQNTLRILRDEEGEWADKRDTKLFPEPTNISLPTLLKVLDEYDIDVPSGKTRWDAYTDAQKEYMANLLQEHGRQNTLRILRDEEGEWADKRDTKLFPHPTNISTHTLNKVLDEYDVEVRRSSRYTPEQRKAIADLLKKFPVAQTRDILAADRRNKLAKERDLELFPQSVNVSVPTLYNIAKQFKVKVPQSDRRWSKYDGKVREHIVSLCRKHGHEMATRILNARNTPEQADLRNERNTELISDALGISAAKVREIAEAAGVKVVRRPRGRPAA